MMTSNNYHRALMGNARGEVVPMSEVTTATRPVIYPSTANIASGSLPFSPRMGWTATFFLITLDSFSIPKAGKALDESLGEGAVITAKANCPSHTPFGLRLQMDARSSNITDHEHPWCGTTSCCAHSSWQHTSTPSSQIKKHTVAAHRHGT